MSKHTCISCHEPMSYIEHNRSPYCLQPNCQRALAQVVTAEKKTKQDTIYEEIAAQCVKHTKDLAQFPTVDPIPIELLDSIQQNTPVVALMPANKNILTKLPDVRKKAFLQHLSTLFTDIKADGEMTLKIYTDELEAPLSSEELALLGYACATCKGYCCGLGGTHAFQDYPSLKHYLSSQSADLNEDELIETYKSYMPTQSYRNACIFQGNKGCTLPREMRSFTCNNYRCKSLVSYQQQLASNECKLTYAVAVDHEKVVGSSVFNAEHFARHQ